MIMKASIVFNSQKKKETMKNDVRITLYMRRKQTKFLKGKGIKKPIEEQNELINYKVKI